MHGICSTNNGRYLRQFNLSDPLQILCNLLLLVLQLLFVGKHLPFAAAASTKVPAKGGNPFLRIFPDLHNPSFGPVLFIFGEQHICNIPGHSARNKYYFPVQLCQGLSFGSISGNGNVFQYYFLIFLSHSSKNTLYIIIFVLLMNCNF